MTVDTNEFANQFLLLYNPINTNCQCGKIRIVCASQNSHMRTLLLMQANEMPAIKSQQNAIFLVGKGQHIVITYRLSR